MTNYSKLNRSDFIALSSQIVVETNQEITIVNQPDGYLKLHQAIREYDCLEKLKMERMLLLASDKCELAEEFALIMQAGFGVCDELAVVTAFKLIRALKEKKIDAKVKILRSDKPISHALVGVAIRLMDETDVSYWIVDSWDPLVVDAANSNYCKYKNLRVQRSFNCSEVEIKTCEVQFKKPLEGPPDYCPTPRKELTKKHPWIYAGIMSIDEAMVQGLISPKGTIYPPQARKMSTTLVKEISGEKRLNLLEDINLETIQKKVKSVQKGRILECSARPKQQEIEKLKQASEIKGNIFFKKSVFAKANSTSMNEASPTSSPNSFD